MPLAIKLSAVLFFAIANLGLWPGETGKPPDETDKPHGETDEPLGETDKPHLEPSSGLEQSFGRLPLYFVENRGQMDEQVDFYVQGSDKTLYFTSKGVTFSLTGNVTGKFMGKEDEERKRWVVKLDFLGTQGNVKPRGEDRQEAVFSYFQGKPEEWNTAIPTYSKLVYGDLWPGIDLVYSGTVNRLKYEFVVKPGADPERIRLAYRGADRVWVNHRGELEVGTPGGGFSDGKPLAYQMLDGMKKEVSMEYVLEGSASDGPALEGSARGEPALEGSALEGISKGRDFVYGFDLGSYDPDKPLVLDPELLISCGYIGGSGVDAALDVALDSSGYIYVTGETESDASSFPVKVGPGHVRKGSRDAFVAKVSPGGTALKYCGYIGGADEDRAFAIAVNSAGNAFVAGYTSSKQSSFPVKGGPDLTYNGFTDGFVARVNTYGTGLDYCGYIGGAYDDKAFGIAVDKYGHAHVTGLTQSPQSSFPVINGPDLTGNGYYDAFVAKLSPSGVYFMYCGYIGGEDSDWGNAIALDSEGRAYVTGWTESSETTFPVLIGPDLTYNGLWWDAFVARVNATGTGLEYCGYIGGIGDDLGRDIAVDSAGRAHVTGSTESNETTFPVIFGPDLTFNGGYKDAFVARVSAVGIGLEYCGYIGGQYEETGYGIAVDGSSHAYVTGTTESDEKSFPVVLGPDLTHNGGYNDAFVARVNAVGTGLDYCGYIGGNNYDEGFGIAADSSGNVCLAGMASSTESTFPAKHGPDLTHNGSIDAFVAKISSIQLLADTYTIPESGGTVHFELNAGAGNGGRDYLLLASLSGTDPGLYFPGTGVTLPLNWDLFTGLVFKLINTPVFADFQKTLGASGTATAQFNTLGPLPPGYVGTKIYFAFLLYNPIDFTSNPVVVEVVP